MDRPRHNSQEACSSTGSHVPGHSAQGPAAPPTGHAAFRLQSGYPAISRSNDVAESHHNNNPPSDRYVTSIPNVRTAAPLQSVGAVHQQRSIAHAQLSTNSGPSGPRSSSSRISGPPSGALQQHLRQHPKFSTPSSSLPSQQPQPPSWSVPNPLLGASSSTESNPVHVRPSTNQHGSVPAAGAAASTYNRPTATATSRPAQAVMSRPSSQMMASQAPSSASHNKQKQRVVLSPEARKALATAIWSAIKSPDGAVAPDAMAQVLAAGLPKAAVLNAARIARQREAQKRQVKLQQQQEQMQRQQQQRQRHQHEASMHQASRPLVPNGGMNQHYPHHKPTAAPLSQTRTQPPTAYKHPVTAQQQPPRSAPLPSVTRPPVPATQSKTLLPSSHQQSKAVATARLEERARWKQVQSGVFLLQKGRYNALPNSISAIVRVPGDTDAGPQQVRRSRPMSRELVASAIQKQLLLASKSRIRPAPGTTPPATQQLQLLDPDRHKRFKIQPKREAKALDRMMRKGRSAVAEALIKQNKELSKSIVNHQSEFFKFHRLRRADAFRLAKSVRDFLDKKDKKKEKDADMAERARLAALRSNDMAAYSKLLDETKNDRLKFLLDKTDECITQISSLLQQRSVDDHNAAEFASASAASTGSYYASAHLKLEEVRQPSILVGGNLKEYQLSGLQWLVSLYNNKLNGILADEMGLGKTIQAISLIAYLMEFKDNLGPYLVIVPLSTLSNWVNEFAKWCPSARVITYNGTRTQRKELYKDQVRNGHFNVLLTTYEYIIRDKGSLKKIHWQYAIVDEGHRMKNAESKFAVTLGTQYTTDNRVLLTGTPLQNSLPELWALLNFLLPTIFNSVESFDQWFNRPFAQFGSSSGGDDATDQMLTNEERMLIIHRLHELLRPFMLRRVKSEVLDQLPEKVEKVLRCQLSSWQKELYKQISAKATEDKSILGSGFVEQQQSSRGLNNVVMQLRKVCNHPYLFSPEGYHINANLIRSSGKVELLDRMLPKLKAAGHRVLLFTQMTAVMTILEDYFAYRGYASLRLDGSTPAEEREKRMYKFNAPDSPYFIFLLSTRAGGLGLNLATADTVIIFDSDWNPMMDLQAQDRAHRIGQRNDVTVFRLISYAPVEEKILSRATEKLNMSELIVEAGKFDKSSVENDNSLERRRMMEVLLTDFDTTSSQLKSGDPSMSDEDISGNDQDGDEGSDSSDEEDLNELLSGNEADYQLYSAIDQELAHDNTASLFTTPDDVPDWIKYPGGKKSGPGNGSSPAGDGSRKRKAVVYDDGLTEKQFVRLMEKQAEEDEKRPRKRARSPKMEAQQPSMMKGGEQKLGAKESDAGGLTEWTFRKLINITKAVIALKDSSTKRRLSEIFLEKPCHSTYPDYYEIIEKPIAINDILRKCRGQLYSDMEEFRADWKLLFSNAKKFNGEGSWVVVDAGSLEKELERLMKKNGFEPKPSPPKRKPLRIKLSLKKLKGSVDESSENDAPSSNPRRKKGSAKKNGKKL